MLPSELSDTVRLSTGGGGITVSVPGTAAFNLDAKTAGGGVTTDLPVTVVGKIEEGCLARPGQWGRQIRAVAQRWRGHPLEEAVSEVVYDFRTNRTARAHH